MKPDMLLKILKYTLIDFALILGLLLLLAYVEGNRLADVGFVLVIFFPFVFTISYFYTAMLVKLRVNLITYLFICAILCTLVILAYMIAPSFFRGYESFSGFIVIQFTLIYFFLREIYAMGK